MHLKSVACSVVLILLAHVAWAEEHQLQKLWETEKELLVPESVLFDPVEKVLYVSNIEGKNPGAKDGTGSIAKVGLDGKVIAVRWVSGLEGPKGMGLHKGLLYVADIDTVVVIDVAAAEVKQKIPVADSKFLNDITIDKDGTLYVSDTITGKVHAITNGKVSTLLEDLKGPNGLLALGDDFYVLHNNGLFQLQEDKSLKLIAEGMKEGVDGVVRLSSGDFVVSCWGGVVYYVSADGETQSMLDTREQGINTADVGFDPSTNTLYVPTFFNNTVEAYEVK